MTITNFPEWKDVRVRLNNNCDNIDKPALKDKFPDAYDFLSTLVDMGVASITISRPSGSVEYEIAYRLGHALTSVPGIHIFARIEDIQRLTDDAELRELWFSGIQFRLENTPEEIKNWAFPFHLADCPIRMKTAWFEFANEEIDEEEIDKPVHPSVSLKDLCQHESLTGKFARRFADRGKLLAIENEMYMLEKAANAYDENFSYS